MATEPIEQENLGPSELLRPPVKGGTGHMESLGRWIDDLMGHSKIQRQVKREMDEFRHMLNETSEGSPQQAPTPLPDPPATKAPKPVPGGTGTETKEARPGGKKPFRPSQGSA